MMQGEVDAVGGRPIDRKATIRKLSRPQGMMQGD